MKVSKVFLLTSYLSLVFLLIGCIKDQEKTSPNVIFILADDMGYGDATCYNPVSKINTPNIDKLAEQGMRFTDAHSPSSVCTPTRYGILTGRYCWRTRLDKWVLHPYDSDLIEPDRLTLGRLFKQNGYQTACFGKWHLGFDWPTTEDVISPWTFGAMKSGKNIDLSQNIGGGPVAAGFDHYFGVDVPNYPPYCYIRNTRIVGEVPTVEKPSNIYGNPGPMQNGWDLEKVLPCITDSALAYIDEASQSEKPFFIYFPLTAPHTPIVPAKQYQGKSSAGDYGDLVVQVDDIVGQIVQKLKDNGTLENTLIVFTSDNGSPARAGDPHIRGKEWSQIGAVETMFDHHPNKPWRGLKADIWEAGHRVPLVVSWPNGIPQNKLNDEPVSLTDFFASFCSLLNVELDDKSGEDSFNILPVLQGTGQTKRDHIVHHSGDGMFALRINEWKYAEALGSGGFSKPNRISHELNQETAQLYKLEKDSSELNNEFFNEQNKLEEMKQLLENIKFGTRTNYGLGKFRTED